MRLLHCVCDQQNECTSWRKNEETGSDMSFFRFSGHSRLWPQTPQNTSPYISHKTWHVWFTRAKTSGSYNFPNGLVPNVFLSCTWALRFRSAFSTSETYVSLPVAACCSGSPHNLLWNPCPKSLSSAFYRPAHQYLQGVTTWKHYLGTQFLSIKLSWREITRIEVSKSSI